ncbi:hypothetical protein ACTI_56750 [Actinoplanes sp. OR16]|uniref:hypothetical protein n=1 Tax=Actinoplanes sp. OR16 TaxID=946334 RepID=UPI000F6FB035|nr:hypothetical protein [Actinoplanes sp. OR16]BBH68990.1 hypothetical protein ACTI_56750 [Actinoplanes sp. OR16]
MSVLTRPAVLLATATVAAGLLVAPGAAFAADTTTTLTSAQMAAELSAVAAASAAAGVQGWKTASDYRFTFPGSPAVVDGVGSTTADLAHGRYDDRFSTAGSGSADSFAVDGEGLWEPVPDGAEAQALRMMGRPAVKYVFTADEALDLDAYLDENAPSPVAMTSGIDGGGSKVTHEDGSADLTTADTQGADVVLHVGATGVLTGAHLAMAGNADQGAVTVDMIFSYGAQTVTLPTAAATVDPATLAKGVAYLTMPATVRTIAGAAATDTRKAARNKKVEVATLRAIARTAATRSSPVKVTVTNVTGGVKVSATNPWTHRSVAYTVTASGRKVVVKKG